MTETNRPIIGRFAPSPTGRLHLGSLATALGSWLMARSCSGKWLLRLDDLDSQRQVPGMADDIMATLERFSLLWDGTVTRQSDNIAAYQHAFDRLQDLGLLYPCHCSRKEIAQSASAPHPDDDCLRYSGKCRLQPETQTEIRSWRIKASDQDICFNDLIQGVVCQNIQQRCGDFIVRRGDGEFAYQLAVVIDDSLTGVNQVVRGLDLIHSTPRQILISQQLGLPRPAYAHLPLVTGPDGSKLSKRDNLISASLDNIRGREPAILLQTLRFLGQQPPQELCGLNCPEILEWATSHFYIDKMPLKNSWLSI